MRAARQRLTTAETLLEANLNLDAQYIGGYTIECALKALILHNTPESERPETLKKITTGAAMHQPQKLLGILRDLGVEFPKEIIRIRKKRQLEWTTDLRYETGRRDTGETIAFLKTAKTIYDWVERQLP